MLKDFKCKNTAQLWTGKRVKKFQALQEQALRRLDILHAATSLKDLMLNPGNHFESLVGVRQGQYSIRINQKWRICFEWDGENARQVEIIDYH